MSKLTPSDTGSAATLKVRCKRMLFALALSLCLISGGCASSVVSFTSPPKEPFEVGPLGHPYGTIIRIEGRWVKDEERTTYWEANIAGKNYFLVQKVNGRPCECRLLLQGENMRKQGDGFVGEGYQDGHFDGLVDGMKNEWPDGMKMQGRSWCFVTHFVVINPKDVAAGWKFDFPPSAPSGLQSKITH